MWRLPSLFGLMFDVVTGRQVRAARALLGWSRQQLADHAVVSLNALTRFEQGSVDTRSSTLANLESALVKAGIEFLNDGRLGEGVRLRPSALQN